MGEIKVVVLERGNERVETDDGLDDDPRKADQRFRYTKKEGKVWMGRKEETGERVRGGEEK